MEYCNIDAKMHIFMIMDYKIMVKVNLHNECESKSGFDMLLFIICSLYVVKLLCNWLLVDDINVYMLRHFVHLYPYCVVLV